MKCWQGTLSLSGSGRIGEAALSLDYANAVFDISATTGDDVVIYTLTGGSGSGNRFVLGSRRVNIIGGDFSGAFTGTGGVTKGSVTGISGGSLILRSNYEASGDLILEDGLLEIPVNVHLGTFRQKANTTFSPTGSTFIDGNYYIDGNCKIQTKSTSTPARILLPTGSVVVAGGAKANIDVTSEGFTEDYILI